MSDVHVLPVNDLKPHDESENCACKPKVKYTTPASIYRSRGRLIVHNSYDGREFYEEWEEGKEKMVQ